MNEINLNQPRCYKIAYKDEKSENLVITFTPSNGYFLYHNDLQASKLCIATTSPNYYIFNPGTTCNKIIDFLKDKNFKNILFIGSSKAGLASLLWGHIFREKLSNNINIFALSFSPQTKLYPFNETLYFPSYHVLWSQITKNQAMKTCAINYGDLGTILKNSQLEGMIIYPKNNLCDSQEAMRVNAPYIKLVPIDYSLHGSFLPFMKQAKDDDLLRGMVTKIFANAQKDQDIQATIPTSENELFDMIKSIQTPTIEELCDALFFKMNNKNAINNFNKVNSLGFI